VVPAVVAVLLVAAARERPVPAAVVPGS
jgi:hypothetical protein